MLLKNMNSTLIRFWKTSQALTLSYLLTLTSAEICPENSEAVAKLLSSPPSTKARKSCPDFKDESDQAFCCPSAINPGTYYCCTLEKRAEIDDELAAEAWRAFFKENSALIFICCVFSFVASIIFISMICKRIRGCPLYRSKQLGGAPTSQILSRYHPVDTIPPKPPSVYEAPPPYDYSTARSARIDTTAYDRDWNCLIDNEITEIRRVS